MSRNFRIVIIASILLMGLMACRLVTQPIENVQNTAATAEAIATTVQQVATLVPMNTLEALATNIPDVVTTAMPVVEGFLNPTGEPVSEWNGIPIMPEATAGADFGSGTYSFKIDATYDEVAKFYDDALPPLGWQSLFAMPASDQTMIKMYMQGNSSLTITAMPATDKNGIVAILLLTQ